MQQFRRFASGYERNRILIWIIVAVGVNQLGFGSIVPVVPLYAQEFGVSQAAIGMTIAVFGLARFLLGVPTGQLADRVGRRTTLAIGGLLTVVGNLLCGGATSFLPFLAARFLAGAGASMVLSSGQIVLADISTRERRGRMMATYQAVFLFAVGFGPLPGGLLAERFGLAAPFFGYAIVGLAVTVVAWLAVPETRGFRGGVKTSVPIPLPPLATQLRMMASKPPFLLISLVSFCGFFARTGALFNVVPLLGKSRLDLNPEQIGLGLAMISVPGLILAYPSGMLVDRFGRKTVIVPATLLTGVSFLVFATAPSYPWFLTGCLAWGVAVGVSAAAPSAYAADMAPAGMNAVAMSSYRMLADAGYVLGPLVLGWISDVLSAAAALYITSTMLIVATLLFARFAPETYRRDSPRD